ncbi:dehydrogenase [Campylobacter mucosalis]|uniref:molybdopterin-containing oxidoreductase family protein n=1 Tax=Campylobacter mucosalis TaxID=202 RepID=UPI0004D40017|nr:molybdopterin-dependent oxidoreductase [Campylobacter mucosalis]KEA45315.1 dehydrogenase [Campylobacter mucosalis]QKF62252.1 anaerobic dehydrogenase [Campylobacter mucosalis]
MQRRSFLKGVGAGLAVAGTAPTLFGMQQYEVDFNPKSYKGDENVEYHHLTCPRNCRDACALIAEVKDGKMVGIKGDPAHPLTQGTACVKGHTYAMHLYNPDRIMYPMKRVGKKTEGKWERISWDQALKEIAAKLTDIKEKFGGEALTEFVYSGNEGHISKTISSGNFFEKYGATRLVRNPCDWPRYAGTPSVIGTDYSKDALEVDESDMYISWGSNESYTAVHWVRFAHRVKKRGGKIIVINTIRVPLANQADMFIQLKPSSDPAFCLAVCKVLIEEDLYDHEFVEKYTMGFEDLVKECSLYTYGELADMCGASVDQIKVFAREYAHAKAPAIMHGDGGQRHFNGARLVRAVTFLPVLTGALTKLGGGLFWAYVHVKGCFNFDNCMPDLSPKDKNGNKIQRQEISYVEFGKGIQKEGATYLDKPVPVPIKACIHYNSNMMVVAPNTNLIKKRIMDDDFFLVVIDPYDIDTCDYADYVLPGVTFMESEDIQNDQISGYVCYNAQSVKPLGEAKTNLEFFNALAKAMGYTEECFNWDSETVCRRFLDTEFAKKQNITYEKLKKIGWIKPHRTPESMKDQFPYYPYAPKDKLVFGTQSGKCELYSKTFKDAGYHPVIDLGDDWDYYNQKFGKDYIKKYPLYFMTPGTQLQDNSNWGNMPYIVKRVIVKGNAELFMTKEDMDARGIKHGDTVEATNEKGTAVFTAIETNQMQPGICYAWNNIWVKVTKSRTGANMLCSDGVSDLGNGSTYTATFVEVKKAAKQEVGA